jgi:hypothetical protein
MIRVILLLSVMAFVVPAVAGKKDPVPPPEPLKALEWMVGNWVHLSEGALIKMNARWSDQGRFLERTFSIRLGSEVEATIRQTVYWDPVSEEVRSWGFSSDGSFESGRWSEDGTRILVARRITYPDGSQGTAVNSWERAGEGRVFFSSASRFINGEPIPDIAPTELEKQ